jgi:hypothetical protein
MPLRHQRVRERAAEIVGRQQADAHVAESALRSIKRQQIELEAAVHNVNLAQQRSNPRSMGDCNAPGAGLRTNEFDLR